MSFMGELNRKKPTGTYTHRHRYLASVCGVVRSDYGLCPPPRLGLLHQMANVIHSEEGLASRAFPVTQYAHRREGAGGGALLQRAGPSTPCSQLAPTPSYTPPASTMPIRYTQTAQYSFSTSFRNA